MTATEKAREIANSLHTNEKGGLMVDPPLEDIIIGLQILEEVRKDGWTLENVSKWEALEEKC